MREGYYRLASERSRSKSIAQFINGEWFCINEAGPVALEEINRRGWFIHSRVKGMNL